MPKYTINAEDTSFASWQCITCASNILDVEKSRANQYNSYFNRRLPMMQNNAGQPMSIIFNYLIIKYKDHYSSPNEFKQNVNNSPDVSNSRFCNW